MDYERYKTIEQDYRERFGRYNRRKLALLRRYFRWYHRLEVRGTENIPAGPALIAANHGGGYDLDIMALSYFAHPERPVHTLIAADWHFIESAWGKYFVGGGIPLWLKGGIRWEFIDPYLREGGDRFPGLAAIFPEGNSGTFLRRRRLGEFFPGVVRIALHYRVPIVPAAMTGFHLACPILGELDGRSGIRTPVMLPLTLPAKLRIVFGEPFELSDHYGKDLSREEERRIAGAEVRSRLLALLKNNGQEKMY